MLLKDRISIVTGGSSGIGRGIALEFAREGARIVIADTQESPLQGKYHEIVVGINLRGVFMSTKLAIPHLKKSKFGMQMLLRIGLYACLNLKFSRITPHIVVTGAHS